MAGSEDKQWASKYLLDPLTAPEPSQETGPGTHYNSTFSPNNPYRNSSASEVVETPTTSRSAYPTPPHSASPRHHHFDNTPATSSRDSFSHASTQIPTSTGGGTSDSGRRPRNNSLPSRYAGDRSNRPLDILTRENKLAYRSPHLRKKHIPGADSIDTLDNISSPYHHEGPYDATLLSRNVNPMSSPIEAVRFTNEEALKATAPERIEDSLKKHRPLDGVAIVPPGMEDMNGRTYNYEEGTDMMIENGGNYKRWPGVTYLPEDLKGKGEPSYSIEKALKEHKRSSHRRVMSDGNEAIEMTSPRSPHTPRSTYRDSMDGNRPRSSDSPTSPTSTGQRYSDWENGLHRRSSGSRVGGHIRKRFGSLRGRRTGEEQT
ncbi:bifunctional dTDP-4-dehydrorhamnose 3,5-epimerase/dTDP-4-dehydrorhamnose reductase [Physcia stellaris]|nr:bifunctional dTDP-4-dehydrorhamnose 3,5-epimerase/dTDP-4-dehydrorhamnose reductase [Physcia stellaris]